MKRISPSILLTIAVALGLNAQGQRYVKNSKFDQKLEDRLKAGNAPEMVPVIIQSHDVRSLQEKLAKVHARNVKRFETFPGLAAEVALSDLVNFGQDSTIEAISSDEPV